MSSAEPFLIDFSQPSDLIELAKFIGTSEKLLQFALFGDRTQHFTRHDIPKRNARSSEDVRVVWEPLGYLTTMYKSLNRRLDIYTRYAEPRYPHPAAHGYVRGRGTIDNAKVHCRASQVLHADIKDFFPSITKERIRKLFISFRVKPDVADILAELTTLEGVLPLGLHCSPLLADIICLEMDEQLQKLAEKYRCKYTRYADDISISGNDGVPAKEEVKRILAEYGFSLSERKFRITKPGQSHFVTGLSVSDTKPRAPRKLKRRLRQELYYCKKFGAEDHIARIDETDEFIQKGINRIDGMVRYIAHIEKEALPNIRAEWAALMDDQGLVISYDSRGDRRTKHFVFFIDETEISCADKKFLALAFVKTDEHLQIEATTQMVLHDHLVDPFSGGRKKALEKKRLHFTDANLDLRTVYIDKMSTFPFHSYLAYKTLDNPDQYEAAYLSLIEKILPHRLMSCDRAVIDIVFEENPRVRKAEIERTVHDLYLALRKTENRSPIKVDVHIGKKADYACFSVPDFLLGVFSRYACGGIDMNEKDKLFFEKLRDQYRIIFDADRNLIFSRKRPFIPWV